MDAPGGFRITGSPEKLPESEKRVLSFRHLNIFQRLTTWGGGA
jgi:hypothetical protein